MSLFEVADIIGNVGLLGFLVIMAGVAYAALVSERNQFGKGETVLIFALFALALALVLNHYLGNQQIEACVEAVNKKAVDVKVKVEIKGISLEPSSDLVKSYEAAVYDCGLRRVQILSNQNDLWRLRFDKRAVQQQIQPGERYRFQVYGVFGDKSIRRVEFVSPRHSAGRFRKAGGLRLPTGVFRRTAAPRVLIYS